MLDWKPVINEDEMYVVLALFMLMGIIQKPTLRSYFSKHCILATPIFGSVISMDRLESVCNVMHFNNNDNIGTTRNHLNFQNLSSPVPSQHIPFWKEKMTKCHIKLFRRLLKIAVLNCMVILTYSMDQSPS